MKEKQPRLSVAALHTKPEQVIDRPKATLLDAK
jgi:hypothetical protein